MPFVAKHVLRKLLIILLIILFGFACNVDDIINHRLIEQESLHEWVY